MSAPAAIETASLERVREKVEAGERLDAADGLALYESGDLLALGELADRARRLRGGGDEVYFVRNLTLNQTNVCRVKCRFCAFARSAREEGAYTLSPAELAAEAKRSYEQEPFNELHLVNGESPHVDFAWYLETVRALAEALPGVHLKCYSASEIHHMATLSGLSYEQVLSELKQAGLQSLTGGGAEIFSARVRKLIAPGKEPAEKWLEVNRVAHGLGIPSHCTMLYGHVETLAKGSITSSACAICRTRRAASSPSFPSPFISRTPGSTRTSPPRPRSTRSRRSPSRACCSTTWPTSRPTG